MLAGGPSHSPKAPIVASPQCPPCWRSAQILPSAEHANLPPGARKVLGPRQRSGRVPNLSSQTLLPCQATAYHSSSSPAGLLALRMASAPSNWPLTLPCFVSCSPWPLHGCKPEEDLGLPFGLQGPRCPPKKASKVFEGTERERAREPFGAVPSLGSLYRDGTEFGLQLHNYTSEAGSFSSKKAASRSLTEDLL